VLIYATFAKRKGILSLAHPRWSIIYDSEKIKTKKRGGKREPTVTTAQFPKFITLEFKILEC